MPELSTRTQLSSIQLTELIHTQITEPQLAKQKLARMELSERSFDNILKLLKQSYLKQKRIEKTALKSGQVSMSELRLLANDFYNLDLLVTIHNPDKIKKEARANPQFESMGFAFTSCLDFKIFGVSIQNTNCKVVGYDTLEHTKNDMIRIMKAIIPIDQLTLYINNPVNSKFAILAALS